MDTSPKGSPAKILIAEDEVIIASDLKVRLECLGYEVCGTALSCSQTIEMADRERPDLVLMDLTMDGDMAAIRTATAIRSSLGLPVVFTTADADMARIEEARSARPFGFILKPFLDSGLKIAIETARYDARAESERRKAEDERRDNESRFRSVFETIENIPVQGYDKHRRVIFWNRASENTYGYTAEEALGRKLEELIIPPHMREEVGALVAQWVEKDIPIAASELELVHKDGSVVPVFSSHVMIVNSRGEKEMYCIDVDLTERRKIEGALKVSEDKYRDLIENTAAFILKIDREGTILFLNGYAKEVFGFTDDEVIGRNVAGIILPEKCPKGRELKAILSEAAKNPQKYSTYEGEVAAGSGKKIWSRWKNRPTLDEDGVVTEWLCVGTDITDRVAAESQLSAALHEKDVLLKEVHHRVKNNLQVLNSLLNLQARNESDPTAKAVIREAQTRVTAMAQVHESLYASESLAAIDLRRYVGKLVNSLIDTYKVSRSRVRTTVDIPAGIAVQIDKAVSCGLILNELISNSLKYAFPGDRNGEISISAGMTDGRLKLGLKDNGVGLPDGLDWRNSGSLGLFLVTSLVEGQLGGALRVSNRGGADYLVDIPL